MALVQAAGMLKMLSARKWKDQRLLENCQQTVNVLKRAHNLDSARRREQQHRVNLYHGCGRGRTFSLLLNLVMGPKTVSATKRKELVLGMLKVFFSLIESHAESTAFETNYAIPLVSF